MQDIPYSLRTEPKITSVADDILDLVRVKKSVSLEKMSKQLGLDTEQTLKWCKMLESQGMISVGKSFLGKQVARLNEW